MEKDDDRSAIRKKHLNIGVKPNVARNKMSSALKNDYKKQKKALYELSAY